MVGQLSESQRDWLITHPTSKRALEKIANRTSWSEKEKADAIIHHFEQVNPYIDPYLLIEEMLYLKLKHPGWGSARIAFIAVLNIQLNQLHTALDLIGLLPGGGEVADLSNGLLYIIEGDKTNASISLAASIPGAGWAATGAKYGIIFLRVGNQVKKLRIIKSGHLLTFSHNSSTAFRQIMQITDRDVRAHHLIPKEFWDHPVIQKAARAKKNPFHMNHRNNGWPIHKKYHSGRHPHYSIQIGNYLNTLQRRNLSYDELAKTLKRKQDNIIEALKRNPHTHIDAIIVP